MRSAIKDYAGWALSHPDQLPSLSLSDWDMVVRQGRSAQVLGRLASELEYLDLLKDVPAVPRRHLANASLIARRQQEALRYELGFIRKALANVQTPIVLLKGAAYVMSDQPAARGRVFGDIDILVPKAFLPDVEAALMLHGWITTYHSAYDQRYYRQWMHEIPPLRHIKRGTIVDVHHNILPDTCSVCPRAEALLENAINIPNSDFSVLAPEDMLLHSATHLFMNGEFENGLRDLSDMDLLIKGFVSQDSLFWEKLLDRAHELNLGSSLFFALRYAVEILETPVPPVVLNASAKGVRRRWLAPVMDAMFMRALLPDHPSCRSWSTRLARWLLFIRSHWLRMPPWLLFPHLARKTWERWRESLGWEEKQ